MSILSQDELEVWQSVDSPRQLANLHRGICTARLSKSVPKLMDGVCSQRGALDHISGVNALPKKNIAGSVFFGGMSYF